MRALLERVIYQVPYAALLLFLGLVGILSSILWTGDLWLPEHLPQFFESQQQLLGQVLLMVLIPAYMLALLTITQRRSMKNALLLHNSGVITDHPDQWLRPLPTQKLCIGMLLGFVYAFAVNLPVEWLLRMSSLDGQELSIILGQCLTWVTACFALSYRLHTASAFDRQGQQVTVELFSSLKLQPFAFNGVDDVLLIAGAMALSVVQSLDAQFRLGNYLAALLVALPAAIYLLLRPMWALHKKLSVQKQTLLARIGDHIAERTGSNQAIAELELSLQHRDRISRAYTWPLDLGLVYRLLFYGVIPPLAWSAAALVEMLVQDVIG